MPFSGFLFFFLLFEYKCVKKILKMFVLFRLQIRLSSFFFFKKLLPSRLLFLSFLRFCSIALPLSLPYPPLPTDVYLQSLLFHQFSLLLINEFVTILGFFYAITFPGVAKQPPSLHSSSSPYSYAKASVFQTKKKIPRSL